MALRELVAIFGVQVDDKELKGLEEKISGVASSAKNLAGAVLGGFAAKAVADFIGGQIEMGAQLDDTANKLGVSTDELQKFQYAAKLSGVEAEGADKALQFLNKNLGEAIGGNAEASKTFSDLGVDMKKVKDGTLSATDLLPTLADNFAKLKTPAEQTAMSMKVFGKAGASLLPLLKSGSEGIDQLFGDFQDLGGGIDKDFIKAAAEADDEIDRMKFTFKGLISQALVPVIQNVGMVVSWVTKALAPFRKIIKETNLAKHALVGLGAAMLIMAGKRLYDMRKQIWSAVQAFRGLSVSIFGAAVPLWLIVAVAALVYLALDDLWTLMQGGDSVIGTFLDSFMGVGSAAQLAKELNAAWDLIVASFKDTGPVWAELFSSLSSGLKDALPYMIQGFVIAVKVIGAAAILLGAFVSTLIQLPGALKAFFNGSNAGIDKIGATIKGAGDAVFGKMTGATRADGSFDPSASTGGLFGQAVAPPPGTTMAPVTITSDTKNTVVIDGSKDPKATGDAVAKSLSGIQMDANKNALGAVASRQ